MGQENNKETLEKNLSDIGKVTNTLRNRLNEYYNEENKIMKQLQEIEKLQNDENKYKDYLEGFDEEFETNCKERIKETPLLLSLFQEFVQQIYRPSKLYKLAHKTKQIIDDELRNTLDKEQQNLLEQWQYSEDRVLDDMIEQAFIFGYAMSIQLRDDAVKQYPYKIKE